MSSTRLALLIVCLVVVAVRGTDPSCAFTHSAFDSISVLDNNGATRGLVGTVFDTFQQASDSVCTLSETCCSKEAEDSFKEYIVEHYRDKVLTKLEDPLMICHNHSFFDEFKQYLEASRANLVDLMQSVYGIYFNPYLDIFDGFYGYLQKTVDTGNTCEIGSKWNEIFYEVYLAAYFGHPLTRPASQLPGTQAFRECFYTHVFLEDHGEALQTNLNGFLRTYNRTMRYFRALKTLDKAITDSLGLAFNGDCADAIMKMTHCSSCAGHVSPTCSGLCLNVLRGCLVHWSDLFDPLEELSSALVDMQKAITTRNQLYYLWGQISDLDRLFFETVSDTYGEAPSIEVKLLTTCNANGKIEGSGINKRQAAGAPRPPRVTVPVPADALNQSAYCLADAVASIRRLPEVVCESAPTDPDSCWNGMEVGSYGRVVIDFDRDSQQNNPELEKIASEEEFQQQIANIKMATRELRILTDTYECGSDDEDEDCTIPETCEYYDIPDVPLPGCSSGSGSGSGSGSTCPTTIPPTTPTTTPSATTGTTTDCPSDGPGPGGIGICDPPGPITADNTGTTGPLPGGIGGVNGNSASVIGPSVTLILLLLCCLFLS